MKSSSKKWLILLIFLVLVVVLVACGGAVTDNSTQTEGPSNLEVIQEGSNTEGEDDNIAKSSDKITIKIADSFPSTHAIAANGTLPWIERIEELGNGEIEVEYYPAEQLGKAASMLDMARNKVADITYVAPLYVTDKMPLSGVSGNPGLVFDSVSGTEAYWKLIEKYLDELEFKPYGVKPLWAIVLDPYQVAADKQVRTLEDFEGMKIRTSGGSQEQLMQSFGATPVTVPGPEIYTAWDRGTIDGTLITFFSWKGYQIEKLASFSTQNAALGSFPATYVVNEEIWDSWPQEVRDVVWQASQEVMSPESGAINLPGAVRQLDEELGEEFMGMGIEIYELPDEELERWIEVASPINDQWVKQMEDRGLPGQEVLGALEQFTEKARSER